MDSVADRMAINYDQLTILIEDGIAGRQKCVRILQNQNYRGNKGDIENWSGSSSVNRIHLQNYNQIQTSDYNKSQMKVLQRNNQNIKGNGLMLNAMNAQDHQRTTDQQLKHLKKLIKKKDELVKFLQKKCGQQIIKSTSRMYKRIIELEEENKKLLEAFKPKEDHSANSKLTVNGKFHNINISKIHQHLVTELSVLSESELHQIVVSQALEINRLNQKLDDRQQKLQQSNRSNRQLRKALKTKCDASYTESCSEQGDENNIQYMSKVINNSIEQLDNSAENNNKVDATRKNQLKRSTKKIAKTLDTAQTQTATLQTLQVGIQTEQDQLINDLIIENTSLKNINDNMKRQLEEFKQEIKFYQERMEQCCNETGQGGGQANQEEDTDQKENNHPKSQIEMNYYEILEIFGIEWGDHINSHEIQQMLLAEVSSLKKQLGKMLRQFRKLQGELEKLYEEKQYLERVYEGERNHNAEMNQFIGILYGELEASNQQIMKNKVIRLNSQYKTSKSYIDSEQQEIAMPSRKPSEENLEGQC